jgi:DNA-binding SARP family transcriptional activator
MMLTDVVSVPTAAEALAERLPSLEREVASLRRLLNARRRLPQRRGARSGEHPAPVHASRTPVPPGALGHWEVTCLGGFRLRCASREVIPCGSRRGWSILRLLLASPRYAAPPELLVETLWPEAGPAAGLHNVQMAIHALRRALRGCGPAGSDEALLFRQGHYLLNPALTIDQDVEHLRRAYDRGQQAAAGGRADEARRAFEEAAAWYGGDYLADSPYEDWADGRRAALQELRLNILSRLSATYSLAGDWERAAGACQEILAADPYREDAVRQLWNHLA